MLRFLFSDAMGNEYQDPDRQWLKDRMLELDEDVWVGSSGDAGLICTENGAPKAGMILIGRSDLGFIVNHSFSNGERNHTLMAENSAGKVVSVEVGGEPMEISDQYFVPASIAWKAVEFYMNTGGRIDNYKWVIR